MNKPRHEYTPQPLQAVLHRSAANEILFGGAAGPGKSHALRHEGLTWCMRIPGLRAYLFRRTYPELEANHIVPLYEQIPPGWKYHTQKRRWMHMQTGSTLTLCHCQREYDRFLYQGAEIGLLLIDELTTFTEDIYTYLRGRVRCAMPIKAKYRDKIPGIICASNPGGIGHEWVKRYWVEGKEPGKLYRMPKSEGGMLRQYIPGRVEDNPLLLEADPGYLDRLDALPEPYRTAYREGDWDIFIGQMFNFNRKDHVIKGGPIPSHAPLLWTFDYGFGKPFSCGYWWVDHDGRLYRWAELYGCVPGQPDAGLRLSHDEIAEMIRTFEMDEGVWGERSRMLRLSGPDAFSKTPDPRGGGQGPSTAEDFARHGIVMKPGDPSRKLGIRQMHQRLRIRRDTDGNVIEPPMMQVYERCEDFIRTITVLTPSPTDPEDVDTRQEDHIYDETKLACMARPLDEPGLVRTGHDPAARFASAIRRGRRPAGKVVEG